MNQNCQSARWMEILDRPGGLLCETHGFRDEMHSGHFVFGLLFFWSLPLCLLTVPTAECATTPFAPAC